LWSGIFNVCYGIHQIRFGLCSQCSEQIYDKSGETTLGCSQMDFHILERYYRVWHYFCHIEKWFFNRRICRYKLCRGFGWHKVDHRLYVHSCVRTLYRTHLLEVYDSIHSCDVHDWGKVHTGDWDCKSFVAHRVSQETRYSVRW
jgi:hypothetical protein